MIAQNPILRGFYPDPSVCRVGKDFYLVNSTFSYVPGVPVFHSRDLVNWVQIGNVLERESQLPLDKAEMSRGIFAPTIRYNNGVFYMITTNIDNGGNFYVTATDPAGPWSDPIWLKVPEGQDGGIDPSLFFEGDKCYYVGQRQKPDAKFFGDCEVWIQELDLEKGELIGEVTSLYSGSMKECVWVEGPHIYHIGDYYYITCAEMGTCFEHSISVARSKNLLGPYENFKCNPLLTHRHLGKKSEIQNIGHGDLVDTEDGQWYLIMLGTRPIDGITELGRETFIAEVIWEDGWPVVNPGIGKVQAEQEINLPCVDNLAGAKCYEKEIKVRYTDKLDKRLMTFRHPAEGMYNIENENEISLAPSTATPSDRDRSCSYVGIRQQEYKFRLDITVQEFSDANASGGLLYIHSDDNYLTLLVSRDGDKAVVTAAKNEKGNISALGEYVFPAFPENGIKLSLIGDMRNVSLYANETQIAEGINSAFLSSELAGGFVGCTYGPYATTNAADAPARIHFTDWGVNY